MKQLNQTSDFESIVLHSIPLIDVRAPIEFQKGAFPGAVNLPLLDDQQRHLIGIRYKEEGNQSAVELGHKLVSGNDRAEKTASWVNYMKEHPNAIIYCFRGGQRSRISQEWLQEALGNEVTRIRGGYKAFRHFFLELFEGVQPYQPLRLTGMTGSGKTRLMHEISPVLANPESPIGMMDLEGIAHHRGSSFGNYVDPQPSQIDFEHAIGYHLLPLIKEERKYILFEDEGRHVGRCFIPRTLSDYWSQGDLILLDVDIDTRINLTRDEYIDDSQLSYIKVYGESKGMEMWHKQISDSFNRIYKRLGGLAHQELINMFENAYKKQLETNDSSFHNQWIQELLVKYYDPMYTYQIENSDVKIVFKGNHEEVKTYLIDLAR